MIIEEGFVNSVTIQFFPHTVSLPVLKKGAYYVATKPRCVLIIIKIAMSFGKNLCLLHPLFLP